jgi:hypothetical protein
MSTYTLSGSQAAGIDISTIDVAGYKKFANRKLSINVHEAHGGYIAEISTSSTLHGDLYIIPDDKDIGVELGKIITHRMLKSND